MEVQETESWTLTLKAFFFLLICQYKWFCPEQLHLRSSDKFGNTLYWKSWRAVLPCQNFPNAPVITVQKQDKFIVKEIPDFKTEVLSFKFFLYSLPNKSKRVLLSHWNYWKDKRSEID